MPAGRVIRYLPLLAALVITLTPLSGSARIGIFHGGGGGGSSGYTDQCSQAGVNCVYGYSVTNRVAAGATVAFELTRFSDSATIQIGFIGPNFLTDLASAEAFGCNLATSPQTVPPSCGYSHIYDQVYESTHGGATGGCDVAQSNPANMIGFNVYPAWGRPVAITSDIKVDQSVGHYLTKTGCGAVAGSGPKSMIVLTNNNYYNNCCGEQGLIEDTFPITTQGSMWEWTVYFRGGVPIPYYGPDTEGGGNQYTDTATPQFADEIGVMTYSGDSSGHTINVFHNGNLIGSGSPTQGLICNGGTNYLCTQSRMVVGCDGDEEFCGPVFFGTMIITSNDLTSVASSIYAYQQGVLASFSPIKAIQGVQLLSTTATSSVSNAVVGYPTAVLLANEGMFTGTLGIISSGTDYFGATCPLSGATNFQLINNGGGNYTLETNGSGLSSGSYTLCVGATQAGESNSPYVQAFTVTAAAPPATVGSVAAYNNSGSTTPGTSFPYHFFKAFKEGDVPAGNTVSLTVASNPIQFGEDCAFGASVTTAQTCPTWPDGSLRGAPFSVFLPQMANQAVDEIVFTTAAGTSTNTTTVTPSTLTTLGDLKIVLSGVNDSFIPVNHEPQGVEIGCYVVAGAILTATGGCNVRITPPSTSTGAPQNSSCAVTVSGTCNTNIYGGLWNGNTPINGASVNGATLTASLGTNGLPNGVTVTSGGSGYLAIGSGSMTLDAATTLNKYGSILPPTCSEEEGAGTFSSATYSGGAVTPTVTAGHIAKGQVVTDSLGATAVVTAGVSWIGGMTLPLNGLFMPIQGNAGNYTFKVTTAGTAGATIPSAWNQTVGGTTSDGTAVWTNEGTSVAWAVSAALTSGALTAQTPLCVDAVSPTMIEYEGFAPYLDGTTPDAQQRGYFWIRLWKLAGSAYSLQAGAWTSHYPWQPGNWGQSYTYDANICNGSCSTGEIRGNAIGGPNLYTRIVDKWPAGWFTNDPCLSGGIGCSGKMDWLGVTPNSTTFYAANSEILNGVIPTLTSTDKLYDAHAWLPLDETVQPTPSVIPLTNPGGNWGEPIGWQGYYEPFGQPFIDVQSSFDNGGEHFFLGPFGGTFPYWELLANHATDNGASYYQQMTTNVLGLAGIAVGLIEDPTGHVINVDPTFANAGYSDPYRYNANIFLSRNYDGGVGAMSGAGLVDAHGGVADTSHYPSGSLLPLYLLSGDRYVLKIMDWAASQAQLQFTDDENRTSTLGANPTCYNAQWNAYGVRGPAWMLAVMDQVAVWDNPNEPDAQYWYNEVFNQYQRCYSKAMSFVGSITGYFSWNKPYDYTTIGSAQAPSPIPGSAQPSGPGKPAEIDFMESYMDFIMTREQMWMAQSNSYLNTIYAAVVENGATSKETANDCPFNSWGYGSVYARTTDMTPDASWDATHIATAQHGNWSNINGGTIQSTMGSTSFVTSFGTSPPQGVTIPAGSLLKPLNYNANAQDSLVVPPTPLTETWYTWCPTSLNSGTINPRGTMCPGNSSTWVTATQTVNFNAGWVYNWESCPGPLGGNWGGYGPAPYYAEGQWAAINWDAYVRRPDMNNATALKGLHEQFPPGSTLPRWTARPH